jgi:hypothetical protein
MVLSGSKMPGNGAFDRDGFPVANIDDIVASKQSANRQRDRESLPRLLKFREWLKRGSGTT